MSAVKHWLCITNEANWAVVKTKKVWGVNSKHEKVMNMVEKDDKLVFYVKPLRIGGIFTAISKPYKDETPIFSGGEFPYRVKIKPLVLPKKFLDFYSLFGRLKFITQKKKKGWGGHLQGKAMRIIPKEDFDLIKRELERI